MNDDLFKKLDILAGARHTAMSEIQDKRSEILDLQDDCFRLNEQMITEAISSPEGRDILKIDFAKINRMRQRAAVREKAQKMYRVVHTISGDKFVGTQQECARYFGYKTFKSIKAEKGYEISS